METSVEDEIQVAEACLDTFCREAVDIFGTEKCEAIHLHCLRHLSRQGRHFDPLFVFAPSAMRFESTNWLLVQLFTGTVSQCEVICRRYLESQVLLEEEIENDVLSDVAASWSGQTFFLQSDRSFMQDVLETEYVNAARVVYRESTILSRALGGNRYFDSLCYRRNCRAPNGNVLFKKDGRWECGKIHYFMSLPDSSSKYELVQIYQIQKNIEGPDLCKRLYFTAADSSETALVPLYRVVKLFSVECDSEIWFGKVPYFVNHK